MWFKFITNNDKKKLSTSHQPFLCRRKKIKTIFFHSTRKAYPEMVRDCPRYCCFIFFQEKGRDTILCLEIFLDKEKEKAEKCNIKRWEGHRWERTTLQLIIDICRDFCIPQLVSIFMCPWWNITFDGVWFYLCLLGAIFGGWPLHRWTHVLIALWKKCPQNLASHLETIFLV